MKAKPKSKDKKTVSNDYYELRAVAKKMGVSVWVVMAAKKYSQSSLREAIEGWIYHMKGCTIPVE